MIKPDIISILNDIKARIDALGSGFDVELAPENFDGYLPKGNKGVVFIGFRGLSLGESESNHSGVATLYRTRIS